VWSSRMASRVWAPTFAFWREVRTRVARGHAARSVLAAPASERNSIWSVIVPADGTSAATGRKRRIRYVCVFWAALGRAGARPSLIMWGIGCKAQ
jgi:hypothetical protein